MSGRRDLRSRDRAAGFLLTETLATFTISAFVLLGLVSASSVLLHAVDRSVAHVQNVDDLGRTIDAIRRDVAGLTRARWNGVEPQGFVFRGGPNSLYFAQARRDPDGTRVASVVALREIAADSGTRLMRGEARLSARATGFDDLHYGPQRELGTGAARLRFSYVMQIENGVERPRLPRWTDNRLLPVAIVIEAVERDTGRVLVTARAPIATNADIGCMAASEQGGPGAAGQMPPDLAALNKSAVGLNGGAQTATHIDGAAPPAPAGPGGEQAPTVSRFCGRSDADRGRGDQQNAAGAPGQPPQVAEGTR